MRCFARRTLFLPLLTSAQLLCTHASVAQERPTRVLIRAAAHDAKVIGSNVGGARIIVRDAETGSVLAEGVQEGSTGHTGLLVTERPRSGAYAVEGTAAFTAELNLVRPTWVEITANGPLGPGGPQASATKRMLLLPGVDVLGDGVVLELNGLTVVLEEPGPGATTAGATVLVRATVRMLCGCPTEPGGLWDADTMTMSARLLDGERVLSQTDLTYAGESSTYTGSLPAPMEAGTYRLEVLAAQPTAGNFGQAVREVEVEKR